MVDITPAVLTGRQLINGYGGGGFRIAGVAYEGSVLVFPGRTIDWSIDTVDKLTLDSLAPVLAVEVSTDVLLVGMGDGMRPLAPDLRAALREKGIIAEPMTTGAACRTFNVLLSEDRHVAAALIAVS